MKNAAASWKRCNRQNLQRKEINQSTDTCNKLVDGYTLPNEYGSLLTIPLRQTMIIRGNRKALLSSRVLLRRCRQWLRVDIGTGIGYSIVVSSILTTHGYEISEADANGSTLQFVAYTYEDINVLRQIWDIVYAHGGRFVRKTRKLLYVQSWKLAGLLILASSCLLLFFSVLH